MQYLSFCVWLILLKPTLLTTMLLHKEQEAAVAADRDINYG